MKGDYLNEKRFAFHKSMEKLLEEAQANLNIAQTNYQRFDEYDEYRDEYVREYMAKMSEAEMSLLKVIELINT